MINCCRSNRFGENCVSDLTVQDVRTYLLKRLLPKQFVINTILFNYKFTRFFKYQLFSKTERSRSIPVQKFEIYEKRNFLRNGCSYNNYYLVHQHFQSCSFAAHKNFAVLVRIAKGMREGQTRDFGRLKFRDPAFHPQA